MASPMNETWWSTFLTTHGRDSEEEQAFLGYLSTHDISGDSGPDVLGAAYTEFHAYMLESRDRASADPGPTRAEWVASQAVAAAEVVSVPQSRTANPGMETPITAATHPESKPLDTAPATTETAPTPPPAETPATVEAHATEPHPSGRARRGE
jgi:hypothetical protein